MDKKETKKMVGVILPKTLIEQIKKDAKKNERSMSSHIHFILKEYFDENSKRKEDTRS